VQTPELHYWLVDVVSVMLVVSLCIPVVSVGVVVSFCIPVVSPYAGEFGSRGPSVSWGTEVIVVS
jgi:hypothetical protein